MFKAIKKIKNKIKNRVDKIVENIALHFIFILGIGITSIIAKLFFKNFLTKKYFFTSWKKHLVNKTFNKMY
jgi:cytochrome c biogenesis protein CcdA